MMTRGCAAAAELELNASTFGDIMTLANFCEGSSRLRLLTPVCPESCGCLLQPSPPPTRVCPFSCGGMPGLAAPGFPQGTAPQPADGQPQGQDQPGTGSGKGGV